MKINSKTSLASIQWNVENQFGQKVTAAEARIIKKAAQCGSLLWTERRLTTTMLGENVSISR